MILTGQKDLVAQWVASKIRDMGTPPTEDFEAIGVLSGDKLIGGVVYTHYQELVPGQHDIRMSCAGEGNWLTKSTLRIFFRYPLQQLKCIRATAMIAKSNRKSRDLVNRLGFKEEGCVRHGLGLNKDMIIYGMVKEDCRWIKE